MSSMLSPWQAAVALGVAMLALTACDPRSPSVPTPKAAQSVALDVAAPAPELVLAFPARTRMPSTAKAGEPGLDSLAEYVGKYPYDGTNYPTLLSNMRTVGPLTKEGDVWSIVGLRPHQGGEEMGAIVIDPARNALRVWLLTGGKQSDFSDAAGADIAWPEQVNKTMANIEAKPVS
jgi:hypothetical protein